MRFRPLCLTSALSLFAAACGSGLEHPPTLQQPAALGQKHHSSGLSPFGGSTLMARKAYAAAVDSALQKRPDLSAKLNVIKATSTSLWLDSLRRVPELQLLLDDARSLQQQQGNRVTVSIVVYDLPNRDCAANASNGEFLVSQDGLNHYKGYIDQLAKIVGNYGDIAIAAIIEPDSLGNIVTNLGRSKCAEAQSAYEAGIAYAVAHLQFSHVALYLDSGHSGWLGWPGNRQGMANVVRRVLDQAGGPGMIRGFATNVSNYTPLSTPGNPQWYDPSNPAKDELSFTRLLAADFANAGLYNHHFIIDTGRNGAIYSRQSWGSWCNLKHAGIGQRPTIDPADGIDAYLWVKPPGEADGTNQGASPRYDWMCSSQDAITDLVAPEAGEWFEPYFEALVTQAGPDFTF